MANDTFLAGLRIEGFRSFGVESPQQISPLTKVHLLAGPNNSGKPNVLRVAQRVIPALANRAPFHLEPSDRRYGQPDTRLRVGVARRSSLEELGEPLRERTGPAEQIDVFIRLLGEAGLWDSDEGLIWFDFGFRAHGSCRPGSRGSNQCGRGTWRPTPAG